MTASIRTGYRFRESTSQYSGQRLQLPATTERRSGATVCRIAHHLAGNPRQRESPSPVSRQQHDALLSMTYGVVVDGLGVVGPLCRSRVSRAASPHTSTRGGRRHGGRVVLNRWFPSNFVPLGELQLRVLVLARAARRGTGPRALSRRREARRCATCILGRRATSRLHADITCSVRVEAATFDTSTRQWTVRAARRRVPRRQPVPASRQ